jgi:hypothetical protein
VNGRRRQNKMPTIRELQQAEMARRGALSPTAIRQKKNRREALESLTKRCPYLFNAEGKLK